MWKWHKRFRFCHRLLYIFKHWYSDPLPITVPHAQCSLTVISLTGGPSSCWNKLFQTNLMRAMAEKPLSQIALDVISISMRMFLRLFVSYCQWTVFFHTGRQQLSVYFEICGSFFSAGHSFVISSALLPILSRLEILTQKSHLIPKTCHSSFWLWQIRNEEDLHFLKFGKCPNLSVCLICDWSLHSQKHFSFQIAGHLSGFAMQTISRAFKVSGIGHIHVSRCI